MTPEKKDEVDEALARSYSVRERRAERVAMIARLGGDVQRG